MKSSLDQALALHRAALGVRIERQQLLASNIANSDTPHFKARDIDFRSALEGALAGRRDDGRGLARTAAGHMEMSRPGGLPAQAGFRPEGQGAVDGNTVNLDTERSAFAENALHYEASLTFVNHIFRSLQQAIQGQ